MKRASLHSFLSLAISATLLLLLFGCGTPGTSEVSFPADGNGDLVFTTDGTTETSAESAATTTTAPQLATVIGLGQADAAIIWKENCNAEGVEICETPDMDAYVKTGPAAKLSFDGESDAAAAFLAFLNSDAAKEIWQKYGYELVG